MDRIFARNFLLFSLLVTLCIGGMGFIIVSGDREIGRTGEWVRHGHNVIIEAEEQAALTNALISSQRGYLLSGDPMFLQRYEEIKARFASNLAKLIGMIQDNPAQVARLTEMRENFKGLTAQLETLIAKAAPPNDSGLLTDIEKIDAIKVDIIRLNDAILSDEYKILNRRIELVEDKKNQYFSTLMIGGSICGVILLILNGFLLNAQSRRSRAERNLLAAEERLSLAIEGTNDGIFDWDLAGGQVFYSGQFFKMLGYDRRAHTGSIDEMRALIHPEDEERVFEQIERYINGELSEFSVAFRMKHDGGRWVWINSRATAVYDDNGRAMRMVGSHSDISYMKQTEQQLLEEKESAERASQAKTDFLAHMSHEIRTPLTAISGIAEILTNNSANMNERQQQLVRTLSTSTLTLKDLVNDILDFSKIENGDVELEKEPFALRDLFEQVISIMSMQAREKGLTFSFDYDGLEKIIYVGDEIRLRQIIINLVGNAIKFTDKGSVCVTARQEMMAERPMMRIDVVDTGIGIAPEHADIVFERFKQADSSVSRKYGGTGLGLPISRNLARIKGGDISFVSEAGKGSTFTLILPLKASEDLLEVEDNAILNKKLNEKIRAEISGESRILLVEDYEGNIVVLSYLIEEIGCAYDVARTGLEAVDLWKNGHYDIVLMDIQMPEMDGFTATSTIRQIEREQKLPRTPIIGMTAHALVGDKDKCIDAGMDAYLPKPIVEADLKQKILYYLRTARAA